MVGEASGPNFYWEVSHIPACLLTFMYEISILALFSVVGLGKVLFSRHCQFYHHTFLLWGGINGDIWSFCSDHNDWWKHCRTLIFIPCNFPILTMLNSLASLSTLPLDIVILYTFICLEGYAWFLVSFLIIFCVCPCIVKMPVQCGEQFSATPCHVSSCIFLPSRSTDNYWRCGSLYSCCNHTEGTDLVSVYSRFSGLQGKVEYLVLNSGRISATLVTRHTTTCSIWCLTALLSPILTISLALPCCKGWQASGPQWLLWLALLRPFYVLSCSSFASLFSPFTKPTPCLPCWPLQSSLKNKWRSLSSNSFAPFQFFFPFNLANIWPYT